MCSMIYPFDDYTIGWLIFVARPLKTKWSTIYFHSAFIHLFDFRPHVRLYKKDMRCISFCTLSLLTKTYLHGTNVDYTSKK